jgi:hypothetical protein
MVQDLIGSFFICALTGCVLSVVVAGFLSQRAKGLSTSGVFAGLLLAAGPIYLGVDYLIYQEAGSIGLAAGSLVFGLYCLRGWWAPGRIPVTVAHGSSFWSVTNALRLGRQQRIGAASSALRHRMLSVVCRDRRLQPHARNTPFADAA